MKRVVIEIQNGKPVVVSCPKKVEVIIRPEKNKTLKKRFKTTLYHIKTYFRIS